MQHLRKAARQKKSKLEMLHWRLHLFLCCTIGPAGTHRFDLPFLPRRIGCQLWNLTPKTFLCSWPQRRSWLISSHDVSTLCWCSCHDNCDNRWGEKYKVFPKATASWVAESIPGWWGHALQLLCHLIQACSSRMNMVYTTWMKQWKKEVRVKSITTICFGRKTRTVLRTTRWMTKKEQSGTSTSLKNIE